jgi:hypothetical protein
LIADEPEAAGRLHVDPDAHVVADGSKIERRDDVTVVGGGAMFADHNGALDV